MDNFSYSVFTRKQAGIIYGAVKRGELSMTKKAINEMYNLVGNHNLSYAETSFRFRLEDAISYLFAGNIAFAQAKLDGVKFVNKKFIYDVICLTAEDVENEWWCHEPGDIVTLKGCHCVPEY